MLDNPLFVCYDVGIKYKEGFVIWTDLATT